MIKEEFTLNKFGLKHYSLVDLCICWCQKTARVSPLWIAYRLLLLTYFISSFSGCAVMWMLQVHLPEDRPKLLIFMTNWTYFLETIVFLLGFILAAMQYVNQYYGTVSKGVLILGKVFWVLYTVTLPCSVVVTAVFWIYLRWHPSPCSIILHTSNSGIMVLDFLLVTFPIRFLHFYMPLAYFVLYGIFTAIYEVAGGRGLKGRKPIYQGLDWIGNPTKAFVLFGFVICIAMFAHVIFSLLSLLKLWLRKEYVLK